MDSPTTKIEQLLSGMLDGVLSEAESDELKLAMLKDPSLESQLENLRVLRKSLSEGRRLQRLSLNFAGSVMLAAKERAADMGSEAPAWVLRPDATEPFQKSLAPSIDSFPLRRWMFAGGLSLAASLLFLFFFLPNAQQPEIASAPGVPGPQILDVESEKIAKSSSEVLSASVGFEANMASESKPNTLLAQSENPATSQRDQAPSLPPVKPLGSVARLGDTKRIDSVPESRATDTSLGEKKQNITLTMLLDFSIAPEAYEAKALEKILDKYNIVYTDELVLDEAQLKILEDSNYVGNMDNTKRLLEPLNIDDSRIPKIAQKQNTEDKMGVLFLKSRAENLSMAMTEIFRSIEQFPDCALEISTDKSVKKLVAQLGSIQVAESASGVAKRLSFGGAQGEAPFAATSVRRKPMSPTNRAKFTSPNSAVLGQDKAQLSYALFLLRPVKK